MKLIVFGATGRTGQFIVSQALDAGHEVTAVVRTPSKLKVQHENLKIVEANIFSAESLSPHMKGQDAVLSALGFDRTSNKKFSGSMQCIMTAMNEAGVKRIIVESSWFTDPSSTVYRGIMYVFERGFTYFFRDLLLDMAAAEKMLEESELNYTVVRPPELVNKPVTDKEYHTVENESVIQGVNTKIPRADVARFMLKCLTVEEFDRKLLAVALK